MMVPRDSRQRVGLGFVLTLSLAIFSVDQLAKYVVVSTMRPGEGIAVVPGTLGLTHAKNLGGAAGILGATASILLLACVASLVALMWLLRSFRASSSCWRVGSALLFGGAASNLADRLFVGAVVDYVHLMRWVFNGADVAVAVGAVALTLCILSSALSK